MKYLPRSQLEVRGEAQQGSYITLGVILLYDYISCGPSSNKVQEYCGISSCAKEGLGTDQKKKAPETKNGHPGDYSKAERNALVKFLTLT